ncbi:hypothetical protein FA13DRAFT_1715908 [Coprinellus micaceus]|uniref:Uncharacterized protein n=1 Tax=Coprinellus micaceus TaxID=71717 RepID=A0A4Y7SL72_COPMI|nr:hypothetical protein FA13DRAFT_1715908 [Coprinellus micaceus]
MRKESVAKGAATRYRWASGEMQNKDRRMRHKVMKGEVMLEIDGMVGLSSVQDWHQDISGAEAVGRDVLRKRGDIRLIDSGWFWTSSTKSRMSEEAGDGLEPAEREREGGMSEIGEEDARGEEVGVREVGHPGTEGVRRPEMFDEDLHVRRIRGWSRGEDGSSIARAELLSRGSGEVGVLGFDEDLRAEGVGKDGQGVEMDFGDPLEQMQVGNECRRRAATWVRTQPWWTSDRRTLVKTALHTPGARRLPIPGENPTYFEDSLAPTCYLRIRKVSYLHTCHTPCLDVASLEVLTGECTGTSAFQVDS